MVHLGTMVYLVNPEGLDVTEGFWNMKQVVCCSPWGRKESDITGRLNNSNNMQDAVFPLKSLFPWQ